jgi:two-component system phosphate regulon sensor histidine kinase PhoR
MATKVYLYSCMMNRFFLSRFMLIAAIMLIVAFQFYWLNRLYREEWQSLEKETNAIFRDVIYNLQVERFKSDTLVYQQTGGANLFAFNAVNALRKQKETLTVSSQVKKDSVSLQGTVLQTSFINIKNHDSSTDKPEGRIEIRGGAMPATVADVLLKMQTSRNNVKLPPMMDTALLRRMSQSGMKVVVNFGSHIPADSATAMPSEKTESAKSVTKPPSVIIRSSQPVRGVAASNAVIVAKAGEPEKSFFRMITNGKSLDDSLPVSRLDSAYRKELARANIPVHFVIRKGKNDSLHRKDTLIARLTTRPATVGLLQPYWYQAGFESPVTFLLSKISLQILFSVFLVAFTSLAFLFLYRNLVAQRKLTEMKNDFISNITHELKTPLATVSVAVEALRNFGGIQNPERTKDYLDISAAELQRLSLLVDKVLKLSLFESRELELKKENIDLKLLTEDVLNTMKLQFDAHKAQVQLDVQGAYFMLHGDKLHITSVIFNLLDNALKYSKGKPEIRVRLQRQHDMLVLEVEDHGIGIDPGYRRKIFDKFFRVPAGDHHNIKGYGLGLSYVAHVVQKHNGSISVESEPGKGSTFTVKFPLA